MNKEYNIKSLVDEHIIIIPEMQRDYVWSVTSDNVYKLLKIINETSNCKTNIGFVYACRQDDMFCLIDGQQRLTTLVLLAFYLSIRNDGKSWPLFQQMIAPDKTLRFTYRVRQSAESFMKELFLSDICPSFNDIRALTAQRWNNDTTVENMIETLHIIDRYVQMNIFSKNDDNLTFENVVNNVMFYYTDIEQTVQGRDIYITMNSCGQPLAKHEYLKPYIIGDKNSVAKSKRWNEWEDWLYRRTKEYTLDKSSVDTAMGNLLRIIYELKTVKPVAEHWETAAESVLSFEDVSLYFNALERLFEYNSNIVVDIFSSPKTKGQSRHFRVFKALLQVSFLQPDDLLNELERMNHLVNMCIRGKMMKDENLLLFLRRYSESQLDLYSFVDNLPNDSIVTSCLHKHEVRKIQFIQHGTAKTEQLFTKAESLNLYYTKDFYCFLNAIWNEKFASEQTKWTEEDDAIFEKRVDTFKKIFDLRYEPLSKKASEGVISNALIARYLLSLDEFDYYHQEGNCRMLGFRGEWGRRLLTNLHSCRIVSQMITNLYDVPSESIYKRMTQHIDDVISSYSDHHDARYYILKYPNSLLARRDGYNKVWLEECWDRKKWNTYNISIYSAEKNWSNYGISMFESLLARASQCCNDKWTPKLPNGIELKNGRDRHGWRIYYDKSTTRESITDYLQYFVDKYKQIFTISPAKEDDNFVFVDIMKENDLIEEGTLLLEYLKDYALNAVPGN